VEIPTSVMGVFYAATACAAFVAHLMFESWTPPTPSEWAAIVALGLLPIGLALYLWDYGIKRGDVQAIGALSYVEPFLGAVLVTLLGRGDLSWSLCAAGILIVGGAAVAARSIWT
jgi:drug/metabolite transporter (DMT)-like permease